MSFKEYLEEGPSDKKSPDEIALRKQIDDLERKAAQCRADADGLDSGMSPSDGAKAISSVKRQNALIKQAKDLETQAKQLRSKLNEGLESLADAFADVKAEILGGNDDLDAICKSVGPDYEIKPEVLKARFLASFGSVDGVKATAAATDKKTVIADKAEKRIQEVCKYYRVPRDRCIEVTLKGKSITLVCKTRGNSVIGVDNTNGQAYRWNKYAAAEMKFKQQPQQSSIEEDVVDDFMTSISPSYMHLHAAAINDIWDAYQNGTLTKDAAVRKLMLIGLSADQADGLLEHIVKDGSQYKLMSKKSGKHLGTFKSKKAAQKRERQIQYFKHVKEDDTSWIQSRFSQIRNYTSTHKVNWQPYKTTNGIRISVEDEDPHDLYLLSAKQAMDFVQSGYAIESIQSGFKSWIEEAKKDKDKKGKVKPTKKKPQKPVKKSVKKKAVKKEDDTDKPTPTGDNKPVKVIIEPTLDDLMDDE